MYGAFLGKEVIFHSIDDHLVVGEKHGQIATLHDFVLGRVPFADFGGPGMEAEANMC